MPLTLREVLATRYVTPFREGGSLPGLVEADDDGLYVVKFRGAAQGARALVAELVAGELGRALGLPVPELVFVEIDPALAPAEPDIWVQELLAASPGRNIGIDFLPGSMTYQPAADAVTNADAAADVIWFDSLVTNPDRSARNPNLLVWHGRLWLIDHGASLFIHHAWTDPDAHARRALTTLPDHVLAPVAGSVAAAHERLAPLVTEDLLRTIIEAVPDAWLEPDSPAGNRAEQRAAYADYLLGRVAAHAQLANDFDEERRAA